MDEWSWGWSGGNWVAAAQLQLEFNLQIFEIMGKLWENINIEINF